RGDERAAAHGADPDLGQRERGAGRLGSAEERAVERVAVALLEQRVDGERSVLAALRERPIELRLDAELLSRARIALAHAAGPGLDEQQHVGRALQDRAVFLALFLDAAQVALGLAPADRLHAQAM